MDSKNILFAVGRPFSPLYAALMRLREQLYRRGIFRVTSFAVPVISVGNLTLGGTGKTPVVQYLARLLQARGMKPAVVSRGYGSKSMEPFNLVSDGKEVQQDVKRSGDEPAFLARTLPGVMVLTGPVRKLPAREAVRRDADVLILDDGFQHLAVRRDLDLVLFNAETLAGNSRVFPGGDLREPVTALRRCHAFVLTGVADRNRERAQRFRELLETRFPGKKVFLAGYRPCGYVYYERGEFREVAEAALPAKVYGFCGIARPENFAATLAGLPFEFVGFQGFSDHHAYTGSALAKLVAKAQMAGAEAFLTTEKDMVKLEEFPPGLPLYGLRMEVDVPPEFDAFIVERLGEVNRAAQQW